MQVYVPSSDLSTLAIVRVPVSEIRKFPLLVAGERGIPTKYQVKLISGSGKVEQGRSTELEAVPLILRIEEENVGGAEDGNSSSGIK